MFLAETTSAQDQILIKLLGTIDNPRYSQIKPEDMSSDLFNYHLKALINKGLIDKSEQRYSLSKKGRLYVESIKSLSKIRKPAEKFKLYSLAILFKKDSQYSIVWNRKRARHPFFGDLGISGESVKYGESTIDAIIRRLKYQTGLSVKAEDVHPAAMVRKTNYLETGELFSDILYSINYVLDYDGEMQDESPSGKNYWVDIESAISNELSAKTTIESIATLLKELQTKSPDQIPYFFNEETQVIKDF